MKPDYELFLEYIKENKVELYPHQLELAKALFENNSIIIPRQHRRSYGRRYFIELLAKFQQELDKNSKKEYLGHEQIINDLRDKGYSFCDYDFIPYIEKLEKRCSDKNKYGYIMDRCLYFLNESFIKQEWYK